jgi:hypothetical protein
MKDFPEHMNASVQLWKALLRFFPGNLHIALRRDV